MKFFVLAAALVFISSCKRQQPELGSIEAPAPTVRETIGQLAGNRDALERVPFVVVVDATTGKRLIPVDPQDPISAQIIKAVGEAVAKSLGILNAEDSPLRQLRRINEASRFFEDEIRNFLNATEGFSCESPPTAGGGTQRSGYPDLKITHQPSGRIAYLDPKLFEQGSRDSTFRSFYYEPKSETNKILDDAHHLIVGIEHDGNDGAWQFTKWHLVDLSKLTVRLKSEFQASNRDLYEEEAILSSGE